MTEFDLRSEAFRANPYLTLNTLRESAPAVPFSHSVTHLVGRYDDCDAALRDNIYFGRQHIYQNYCVRFGQGATMTKLSLTLCLLGTVLITSRLSMQNADLY